jgi:hypothetical protein
MMVTGTIADTGIVGTRLAEHRRRLVFVRHPGTP